MRVGVVGAGVMGSLHSRVYYELPGVELVGVADTDLQKAREVANMYGALAFNDVKELLGRVDAVTVAVPTKFHKDITKLFLENGVDVLVEKPMSLSLAEAEEMIKAARVNNRILMVGHIERFNPIIESLKNIIKNENVQEIETRRRNPFVSRIEDCGVTLDIMVHDIDVVRYITGEDPKLDYVIGGPVKSKHDDWSKVVMKYGTIPVVHMADRRTQKKIRKIEVNCEDKLIDVDYVNQEIKIYSQAKPVYNGRPYFTEKIETIKSAGEPLKLELIEFVDCVKKRRKPKVNGEEGKKNLEIVLKILEKMERSK